MAIEILAGDPDTVHISRHDLESVYYVMIWSCIVLAGPNYTWRAGQFTIANSPLSCWILPSLNACSLMKQAQFTNWRTSFPALLKAFHPYFDFIKETMTILRDLFFDSISQRGGEAQVNYDNMIEVLEKIRDKQPLVDDPPPEGGYVDDLANPPPKPDDSEQPQPEAVGIVAPTPAQASTPKRRKRDEAEAADADTEQGSTSKASTSRPEADEQSSGSKKRKVSKY